jgi:hypothetical protein
MLFSGGKRPGRELAPLPEVKKGWSFTFTPLVFLRGLDIDSFTFLYLLRK